MLTQLRPAFVLLLAMTLLTGLAYPLAMTGIALLVAPGAASGSLVFRDGLPVGSDLVGQAFARPEYLHPRPSASDYGAMPSGASNLGPASAGLRDAIAARRAAWQAENGVSPPVDAVTASGSGLDPHVSPENAQGQAARIAAARGVPVADVLALITAATEAPWLGLYGQPRVHVLRLNLALDAALPLPPAGTN